MSTLTIDCQCRQNSLVLEEDVIWTLAAREEKSMPSFMASKDRLTLSLGADAAGACGDCAHLQFKILGPLGTVLNLLCLGSMKMKQSQMIAHLFATQFTESGAGHK